MLRTWGVPHLTFVVVASMLLGVQAIAQQVIAVARSGQHAVGQASDVEYWDFSDPVVSNDGIISFHAKVGPTDISPQTQVGYIGQPLSLQIYSTQGDSAPSAGAGRTMVAPRILALADGGYGAGDNMIAGPGVGSDPFGLFAGTAGNYVALAAPGMVAPDTGGALFDGDFTGPTINRSGQIAFRADLDPGEGLFLATGGAVSKIVLTGETAPVVARPYFSLNTPAIGLGGHVTFISRTGVSGNLGPIGVFAGLPGAIQHIADGEAPAPGANPGDKFGNFVSRMPVINNLGQVTFASRLIGDPTVSDLNNEVLWTNMTGSVAMLLREGQQAPGMPAGVILGTNGGSNPGFESHVMNNTGEVAVTTLLAGGPDKAAIYVGSPGAMVPVVLSTDPIPGLPPELIVGSFDRLNMNDAGQMVFQASLEGPGINQFNFRAIIGYDPIGGLMLIGRGGTPIPGIADIPQEIIPLTGSLAGEVAMTLSGSGMVPFIGRFTDGERLLVATIPEPSVLSTVIPGLAMLLGRSASRRQCPRSLPPRAG